MPSDDEEQVFFLRAGVGNARGAQALLEKEVCVENGSLHRNIPFDDAGRLLLPFIDRAVVIESTHGQLVGVLIGADVGRNGVGSVLVHEFRGTWTLVKTWSAIKTARMST